MDERVSGIVPAASSGGALDAVAATFGSYLAAEGLPAEGLFAAAEERRKVLGNLRGALDALPSEYRSRALYLSKFAAAVIVGLFDAALNYLWDETVSELRRRVAQYDLAYFFDSAVSNPEKRKGLRDEEDLPKLDDSELIRGANEIGLISDLGYKHLDYIRYMRNWASAAHPNQTELGGYQLLGWLETCVREVIALPPSNVTIEIKRFLANIKSAAVSEEEAEEIATFFDTLPLDRANSLVAGLFGLYTRADTTSQTRQNIQLLAPALWARVDEETRNSLGVKYGRFVANNDQAEKTLAHQFLEIVGGNAYIPEDLRTAEFAAAIENLLTAHRGANNFYNEPPFARALERLVGERGNVPRAVNHSYVVALVEVFLTNGHGVAWNGEPVYLRLLEKFNTNQAALAVLSFRNDAIASRLQFTTSQDKYRELVALMEPKVASKATRELVSEIKDYKGPLDRMRDDSRVKARVNQLPRLLT